MKKVLILAYDFPPYVSVGGLRPYSWYKYFKEFGLYPIVVTRQWGNKYGNHLDYIAPGESNETIIEETEYGTIIRTPYKPNLSNRLLLKYGEQKFLLIRKIITAYYEFMQFLFFVGPKSGLFFGAKEYIKANKVDYIIATGEPFVLFKYASKLSSVFNIPWIADYRDPWSQNSVRSRNLMLKYFNIFNEKRFLKNVEHITTVSDFFKSQIASAVKSKTFSIHINGYDSDFLCKNVNQKEDVLSICFAGTIYDWHPWKSFLTICSDLIKLELIDIEITFIGINKVEEIKSYCFEKHFGNNFKIKFLNRIPYTMLLNKLMENNVLILFNDYAIMGTKIYDYLASERTILFCYTQSEEAKILKNKYYPLVENPSFSTTQQENLIIQTNSGIPVRDTEHLKEVLLKLQAEFNENSRILCNTIDIKCYSRKNQAKKLVEVLNSL